MTDLPSKSGWQYAATMMLQELVDEIDRQPAWRQHGKRAPHKPLTILYAISQALSGNRIVRYEQAEPTLRSLLDKFGPPRQQLHPEHPVWRLRRYKTGTTSFWEIQGAVENMQDSEGNPYIGPMRQYISFGLSEPAANLLCVNPANAYALAATLAEQIVPPTLQGELLDFVGIGTSDNPRPTLAAADPVLVARTTRIGSTLVRDRTFSRKVRAAYSDACAICSISPRLAGEVFGLEAAHIRWANAGGPDELRNGVCLCRMHHHALDKGAIKIDDDMRVRVSSKLVRSRESDAMFACFSGERIRLPKATADHPHLKMLEWHWSEVFKG